MHERAAGALRQLREERIPSLAIAPGRLDLDELVIGERPVGLAGDRLRQSGRAQPNDRLQTVGEAAKMAALAFRKLWLRHPPILQWPNGLEEVDQREKLLYPGAICLDLGAAPGSWSQYARRRVGQGRRVFFDRLLAVLPERPVDIVLSDMAPKVLKAAATP